MMNQNREPLYQDSNPVYQILCVWGQRAKPREFRSSEVSTVGMKIRPDSLFLKRCPVSLGKPG
jgi:hypothetical protein